MKLKCDACGREDSFENDKKAWLAGWDIIVVAGCRIVTCGDCPTGPEYLKQNDNGSNS